MSGLEKMRNLTGDRDGFVLNRIDSDRNIISVAFRMNQGASLLQIKDVERRIGKRFPDDFKMFMNMYNGARLYDYDGLDGFVILSDDEIIKTNNLARKTFEEDWRDDLIIFAKYIGENNYLAFNSNSEGNKVVDCFFEELPDSWQIIANSFDEFLCRLIEENGRKYWLT